MFILLLLRFFIYKHCINIGSPCELLFIFNIALSFCLVFYISLFTFFNGLAEHVTNSSPSLLLLQISSPNASDPWVWTPRPWNDWRSLSHLVHHPQAVCHRLPRRPPHPVKTWAVVCQLRRPWLGCCSEEAPPPVVFSWGK